MITRILRRGSNYGKLMLLTGLLLGLPLVTLPFHPSEARYAAAFLWPMLGSIALGFTICLLTYREREQGDERRTSLMRGSMVILCAWVYSILLGSLPFLIAGLADPLRALFESASGWTTTGLTVLDVDALPRVFLFYRSLMQYCGGIGFILVMALVVQSRQSMSLYNAEGHRERFLPSLRQTARFIFIAYGCLWLIGIALYLLFGMQLFDAVCYSMSAVSTAGFSTQASAIAGYQSLPIELTTVVLMIAGASNFAILLLLTKGQTRQVLRITELRFMVGWFAAFVVLTTGSLVLGSGLSPLEGFRQAVFGVASVMSSTGYSTMDYFQWPPVALGLMMILMVVGGSAGSTAGGIKLSRTYFLARITYENIVNRMSPAIRTASPTYQDARGKVPIDDKLTADTFGFVTCYLCILVVGTLLIALTANCSLIEAMFEFTAVLGTVGITSGITNAATNGATLIVEIVGMLLGRLEIFVVFFGFTSVVQLVRQRLGRRPG